MTDLRIRKAGLLLHPGRGAEAEALAARILRDTRFPGSGVSEDARIVTDGYASRKLHTILAIAAAERGDDDTTEAHFCKARDLLWRELEFWDLDEALRWVAYASRRRGRECGAAALRFAVRVARFSQEPGHGAAGPGGPVGPGGDQRVCGAKEAPFGLSFLAFLLRSSNRQSAQNYVSQTAQ